MQATPASITHRTGRDPLVGGLVLITIGAALLVAQANPDLARFVVLVIGIGLLAIFAVTRTHGALVAGSIVTGVGTGIVLSASSSGNEAGGLFLLSLGSGFVAIWAISYLFRLKERHFWPLIPGLILISIGSALTIGGAAMNVIPLWPLVFIVLGVLVIGSAFVSGRRPGTT